MDVCINTEEVLNGINAISAIIQTLSELSKFLNAKLQKAGEDFTSTNFNRATSSVDAASESLDQVEKNLLLANAFMDRLTKIIEEYHKLKY